MGIRLTVLDVSFRIPEEEKERALQALKGLLEPPTMQSLTSGGITSPNAPPEYWYAFTSFEAMARATTLEEMLLAWRWRPDVDAETGDIINLTFTGQKLGDEEILFGTLKPYVDRMSYIDTRHDNFRHIWRFDDLDPFHERDRIARDLARKAGYRPGATRPSGD